MYLFTAPVACRTVDMPSQCWSYRKTSCFQKIISRSHSAGTVQNNEKSYFYMSSTSIIKESVHAYLVICIVLVVEPYWDYTHSDWSITSLSHNANGGAHIDLLFPFPFVGFWLLMLAAPSFHLDLFWSLVVNVTLGVSYCISGMIFYTCRTWRCVQNYSNQSINLHL